jgi:hypothetical protein
MEELKVHITWFARLEGVTADGSETWWP